MELHLTQYPLCSLYCKRLIFIILFICLFAEIEVFAYLSLAIPTQTIQHSCHYPYFLIFTVLMLLH